VALTVEDGSGVASADSYITTTQVTTYADEYGVVKAGFVSLTTPQKEAACRMAAVVLDSRWSHRFPGYRATEDQGLTWPRTDALYTDGYAIDYEDIPVEVERAQAHLALLVGQGTDIASDTDQTMEIEEVSAASGAGVKFSMPISTKQFRAVDLLLERVLTRSGAKWSKVPA